MEIKRKQEIEQEAKKRLDLWLKHSSFDEMSIYGSKMRFEMSIGLIGYPFQNREWMQDSDFQRYITDEEFKSVEVDEIIIKLFDIAQHQNKI